MSQNNKKVYMALLSITAVFFVLLLVVFILDPGESTGGEGDYILPGDKTLEAFYPIFIIPILLICGYIALFLSTHMFLRIYVKTLGKNKKIGLASYKELSKSSIVGKIFVRSLILSFFILNICYTLVSQEEIVKLFIVNPNYEYNIPDPALMYAMAWIIAIPCSFILIPIWAMNDIGLVAAKENSELEFQNADMASGTLYKVIKGYAGVGFMYSLVVMIIAWSVGVAETQYFILQILSPIMFISFAFPIVIYIEMQRENLREKIWITLQNLNMANKFEQTIALKAVETPEEIN